MTIQEALLRVGDKIVGQLKKLAPKRSGNLQNSITNDGVTSDKGENTLTISMLRYGAYQDSGVQGSGQPFSNGRQPKSFANKFTSANAASYLKPGKFKAKYAGVANQKFEPWRASVAYYGIRPQPFINPGINEVLKNEGRELLTQAGVDEIITEVEGTVKDVTLKA
jgi:hypothetical protein